MWTQSDVEEIITHLLLVTNVTEEGDAYWVRDEYGVKIAKFYSFVEAYRYRLAYIASKLEGGK